MEIEEVNNHPLHGVKQHIPIEEVAGHSKAFLDIHHASSQPFGLLFVQRHYGVLEKQHPTTHTIITHRRSEFGKLCHSKHIQYLEIFCFANQFALFTLAQDKTIASMEPVLSADQLHFRFSVKTQGVRQIPQHLRLLLRFKSMAYNYVLHTRSTIKFACKGTKKIRHMQIFNVIKSFYGLFYAIHNSRFLQRLTVMWVTCFFLLSGEKPRGLPHQPAVSRANTLLKGGKAQ